MKAFLRNLLIGLPLAFGAMLTLIGVALAFESGDDRAVGFFFGMVGIPILFASLTSIMSD